MFLGINVLVSYPFPILIVVRSIEDAISPDSMLDRLPTAVWVVSLRKSINILEYSSVEYPIATRLNPGVFKTHTIHDKHLEYSYQIWLNTLCAISFADFLDYTTHLAGS